MLRPIIHNLFNTVTLTLFSGFVTYQIVRHAYDDSHTTSDGVFGQFPTGVGNTDATFILELLHFIKKLRCLSCWQSFQFVTGNLYSY
ncbi:aconitate hydratase [Trifolium repens]|nr:aconitate hydratase [Trifolium repens]